MNFFWTGREGLQQVDGIPSRRRVRGHALPEHVERGLRGRRLEADPVELGDAQSSQQSREGDEKILSGFARSNLSPGVDVIKLFFEQI